MNGRKKLLVATHNQGKVREYAALLSGLPVDLLSLDDLGITHDVEETGTTFRENAWLKAHTYSRLGEMLTLSDDSGLEVDALGGEPGVHSARYGGDACHSDEERVDLLLSNLQGVPWERRTSRFLCFIAICDPGGVEVSVVGSVAGMIQYQPEGNLGFGYDPVFYLPTFGRTIAQIPLAEKNLISHRGDAVHRAAIALGRLVGGS
ncbi:MAG: RdgB/HAM1 family non-canonical purine NTP pyrophosphatase [Chloroflexi bacterium]|nr:RdgB/HAM1 family non-canonical purine NTP pyrophosphatase [Chloroflexota bacterium]